MTRDDALRNAEAMWSADAASRLLGMEILDVDAGHAVVSMTVRNDMINGWDVCHGGFIASLADSAFAVACNSRGQVTVASSFDISFLEPAHLGDTIVATAHERTLKGRNGIFDVTVHRVEVGLRVIIAEFRGRSRALGRKIVA